MEINTRDGYRFTAIQGKDMLLLESGRIREYMTYARTNGITALSVQGYHRYELDNVDFLKDNTFFTSLHLVKDLAEIDISAIHHLRHLRELIVFNEAQAIDFSCFPEIMSASIDWNSKVIQLGKCTRLSSLTLRKYKPRSGTFEELSGLDQLSYLEVTQSGIVSLNGLEKIAGTLKTLELHACKKLSDYEPVLERLTALEKLILTDCGSMESLSFITKMEALKFFSFFGTHVLDGDLRPLIRKTLDYAGFDDKRQYSHKMKEVNLGKFS